MFFDSYSWYGFLNTFREAESVSTETLNNATELAGGGGHDTFAEAVAALPASGGRVILAETTTETADLTINKRLHVVGQGAPAVNRDAPAYIDMGGNTLQIAEDGQTWEQTQVQNGHVIIGEDGQVGGQNDITLASYGSRSHGVELRGSQIESTLDLRGYNATGDGIIFNPDTDTSADYLTDSEARLTGHSNGGHGINFTGRGSGTAMINGVVIDGFLAENNTDTGWVADSSVEFESVDIRGYGVEDGDGYDVSPANSNNVTVFVDRLRGGGSMNINGIVRTNFPDAAEITGDDSLEVLTSGNRTLKRSETDELLHRWNITDGSETVNDIRERAPSMKLGRPQNLSGISP